MAADAEASGTWSTTYVLICLCSAVNTLSRIDERVAKQYLLGAVSWLAMISRRPPPLQQQPVAVDGTSRLADER